MPYLNYYPVNYSLNSTPSDSSLEVIDGGAHAIMYEKTFFRNFRIISKLFRIAEITNYSTEKYL